jgi:transcriptional regulator with XRE-family HTH domain
MTREQSVWAIWGLRIAARRKEAGYTQSSLAERLHVTQGTVSKWENGTLAPDDASKFRLAEVLDRTVNELFEWPLILPPERQDLAS